jgi:hypothetical protein
VQYVALIHGSEAHRESLGNEQRQALYDRYIELFGEDDRVIGGGELQSSKTATTVRVRNGDRLVTGGPYAEVKEALGGYIVLECDSIERPVSWPRVSRGPSTIVRSRVGPSTEVQT